MKKNTPIIVSASILAISLMSAQTFAASGTSKYVENVGLSLPGMAAIINIENQSANKLLSSLNLKVKTTNMQFDVSGSSVVCKGTGIKYVGSTAQFGPVNIMNDGTQINTSSSLYGQQSIDVAYLDSDNKIAEAGQDVFTVPLNSVKNGHPAVRVDALEELNKKLQTHIQGGGKAIDFYKQDQEIVLQRPISLTGACAKKNNPFKASVGYETKNHTIQVKYKGDPSLTEKPVLNAQLIGNMPNQVDAGDQPFKLHTADFMANIPHYFGQCVPNQNPVIRVNYHMSGDELGTVDFRINSYSNQYADYGIYYEKLNVVKNPKAAGGNSHLDFEFPLKELLSQQKYSWMAIHNNKTHNHNMVLQVRYKPQSGEMTQWQDFDTAIFKHRCVPQVNVPMGGVGGKIGYDNNGGGSKPLQVKPIQVNPTPKPLGKAAPQPAPTPKPLTIKAVEPKPPVELQLKTR